MLYEYASIGYLKKLHLVVSQLIDGVVDPLLVVAAAEGRDALLTSRQWGIRDTSGNWANNAWPLLKDLQASLSKDIAMRAFDQYKQTATNDKLRGAEQFSTNWLTPEEEREYEAALALINHYASSIDDTLDPQPIPRWDDYNFAYKFSGFAKENPRIPKFRIRTDLVGQTGQVPPRTGVYISASDPHASVQFAAAGNGGIRLRQASTFNDLGLDALKMVGREHLWFDAQKMLEFTIKSKHAPLLRDWVEIDRELDAELAPSAVARMAFTNTASVWHFVELLPDEYEDTDLSWERVPTAQDVRRLAGGELCQVAGYYFSPAIPNSRRFFNVGERMPVREAHYGQTIWQWDLQE